MLYARAGGCGGRTTFKYTRIEVGFMLNRLAQGKTVRHPTFITINIDDFWRKITPQTDPLTPVLAS